MACASGFLLSLVMGVVARAEEPGIPKREARFVLETVTGRVVFLGEAMQRLHGVKWVDEARERTLALETPAGTLQPLVEDVRGRHLGPIVLDANGGAASGLNSGVLDDLGVRVYEMNGELSRPAHPIDTDSVDEATGEHVLMRVARAVEDCGALFGIGWAVAGFCPGTSVEAVAEGRSDETEPPGDDARGAGERRPGGGGRLPRGHGSRS